MQESRIEKGDDEEEIKTWTDSIDNELGTWDNEITNASKTMNTWKEQEDEQAKLHKEEIEAKARQDLFKEQLEFDQAKMKQRMEHELKMDKIRKENEKQRQTNAKLPKLVITKFNGTPLDWLRFWNQFEAEIDKADVAAITKFSYLSTKNILKTKYGDDSEIVNAYVQNIMYLPVIQGTNAGKIHDFYTKLLFNVQSLETLGKLRENKGRLSQNR